MTATMARQGGWVQLEQSDMHLALNMAKMAKGGFLCTIIEKTQYLIKKPDPKVGEEVKRGVEFPGQKKMKAAIERHPAMLCQNHTAGCLHCQNGIAKNPQARWRRKGTGIPPPNRCRQPTPEPTPPLPRTPPAPTGNTFRTQCSQIVNLPTRYAYSHTFLPCAEFFTLDASAQNSQHNTDFDTDILTDEGTSIG